jgi:hypothetical protein
MATAALLVTGLRMFRRTLRRQVPRFETPSGFLRRDPTAAGGLALFAMLHREVHLTPFGAPLILQSWDSHTPPLAAPVDAQHSVRYAPVRPIFQSPQQWPCSVLQQRSLIVAAEMSG